MPIGMRTRSTPRKMRRLGVEPEWTFAHVMSFNGERVALPARDVSAGLVQSRGQVNRNVWRVWNVAPAVIGSSSISFSFGWWLTFGGAASFNQTCRRAVDWDAVVQVTSDPALARPSSCCSRSRLDFLPGDELGGPRIDQSDVLQPAARMNGFRKLDATVLAPCAHVARHSTVACRLRQPPGHVSLVSDVNIGRSGAAIRRCKVFVVIFWCRGTPGLCAPAHSTRSARRLRQLGLHRLLQIKLHI